jgi:hypothetical protein
VKRFWIKAIERDIPIAALANKSIKVYPAQLGNKLRNVEALSTDAIGIIDCFMVPNGTRLISCKRASLTVENQLIIASAILL